MSDINTSLVTTSTELEDTAYACLSAWHGLFLMQSVQWGGWSGLAQAPTPWLVRRGVCFRSVLAARKPGKARPSQGKPVSSGSSGGTVSRERLSNTRAVQLARVCSTGSGSGFGLLRGQMDDLDRLDGVAEVGEVAHQFRPQPAAHPAHA